MARTCIQVAVDDITTCRELVSGGKKIQAIKHLRTTGRVVDGSTHNKSGAPGLRQAKLGVEFLASAHDGSEVIVVPEYRVKALKITGPEGELEVDVETLQLKFLTHIEQFGLYEVARLIELVDFIRQWQGDIQAPQSEESRDESVVNPNPAD